LRKGQAIDAAWPYSRETAYVRLIQIVWRIQGRWPEIRADVGHVFHWKNRFGLFFRVIDLARLEAKLTRANLACNFDRLIFREHVSARGGVRPEAGIALKLAILGSLIRLRGRQSSPSHPAIPPPLPRSLSNSSQSAKRFCVRSCIKTKG